MMLKCILVVLLAACFAFAAPPPNLGTIVNLRIEGATRTLFEKDVFTRGHIVTTKLGGTHQCNGLNLKANPLPGPTCTSALDDGSKIGHFSFDGTFDPEFDDFFITRIGPDNETSTEFWGLLLEFQFTPVGGCQQEVKLGSRVLWAFNAFNKKFFLELTGPSTVKRGGRVTLKVVDGTTGVATSGASITGLAQKTDVNGEVTITLDKLGVNSFKADRSDSIRSNALDILVV